jgi:hypothetical protein
MVRITMATCVATFGICVAVVGCDSRPLSTEAQQLVERSFIRSPDGPTSTVGPSLRLRPTPKKPSDSTQTASSNPTGSKSSTGSSSNSGSNSSSGSNSNKSSGSSSGSNSNKSSGSGGSSGGSSSNSGSNSSSGANKNSGSSSSSSSGSSVYGVHNDIMLQTHSERVASIQRTQSLHAKIVRTSLKWGDIEGSQGSQNWSGPDGALADIASSGIAVLATLWGSPSWATGSSDEVYVPTSSGQFTSWVSAYASFASAAAARYKGKIKYYELWNEENIQDCWHPNPNVSQYVSLYKAVYAAIKSADPGAQVGMGGVTNLSAGNTNDINGKAFLGDLYSNGVYPDAVVIHAYAPSGNGPTVTLQYQNNFSDIAGIHSIMESHGQGSKQLWVTEWGWQSNQVGETNQATYTAQALNLIASTYNYVTLSTLFLQEDVDSYSFGLYQSNGSERPAGSQYQSFAGSH